MDGHKYNFGELGGPHTIVTNEYDPPAYYNYTYTLDICAPLKRKGDVKKEEQCGGDARGMFTCPCFSDGRMNQQNEAEAELRRG